MKRFGVLNQGHWDLIEKANQRRVKKSFGPNYPKWPWAEIGNKFFVATADDGDDAVEAEVPQGKAG
jgi:hypothetical protein